MMQFLVHRVLAAFTAVALGVAAFLTLGAAAASASSSGYGSGMGSGMKTAAPAKAQSVSVARNDALGRILADGKGRTLYLFEKDMGTTTACTGQCVSYWPAFMASGKAPAVKGAKSSKIGSANGQVTYAGHLLYYFVGDEKPGDVNGLKVGGWDAVAPNGKPVTVPNTVAVAQNPTLGSILVDNAGRTLYLFAKDQGTTTACTGQCVSYWPAFMASGQLRAGSGLDPTQLSSANGQVTYAGHLLYYYVGDKNPGDATGISVAAWFAVAPDGKAVGSATS
jgi:predicted lipoprotein with Yx(FWY)xxD motif